MFGSLVVVFPTPHEGGALVLRHDGRDWTFDSGKTLSAPGLAPSIAFVAFFSDVDHEVTPVVSGHRVTATYNLYFSPHTHTPDAPESTSTRAAPTVPPLRMFQPSAANVPELASTLHELLADPTFLQSGGTLGFGLRHEYPLPKTWGFGDPNPLVALERWLKGADAALLRACQVHGLQPVLRMLSEDEGDFEGHDWTDTEDVVVRPTLLDLVPYIDIIPDSIDDYLQYPYGATRMFRVDLFEAPKHTLPPGRAPDTRRYIRPDEDRKYPYAGWRWGTVTVRSVTVHMLTATSSVNRIESSLPSYGNEVSIDLMYMIVYLIVGVGRAGQRDQVAPECVPQPCIRD